MVRAAHPVTINWYSLIGANQEYDLSDRFAIQRCSIVDKDISNCDIVVLEKAAFGELAQLRQFYLAITKPVLIITSSDDEIVEILSWLQEDDGLCTNGTHPELISHKLEQLHIRRTYVRDPLTGLVPREQLVDNLNRLLITASGSNPVSVIIVDIDNFKAINDQHGHSVGDQILRQIGSTLNEISTEAKLIGRIGGDEFTIVTCHDSNRAKNYAEYIRRSFSVYEFHNQTKITLSLGIATADSPMNTDDLLRNADEANYAAKAMGRDRCISYGEFVHDTEAAGENIEMRNFENMTRIVSERIANHIAQRSRKLFQNMKDEAELDSLTKIYNRRYLDRKIVREFDSAVNYSRPLSLALIDIDHFGKFNRQYGLPTGDQVLREVAQILHSSTRITDWVARYGGDEFCLVMPDTKLNEAVDIVSRILKAVNMYQIYSTSNSKLNVSISIGIDELGDTDKAEIDLIERTSKLLFDAKRASRNRFMVSEKVK